MIYPLIFTLAHTGARRDEVRLLNHSHIDLKTNTIHFNNTKNKSPRTLKLEDPIKNLLKTLPKRAGPLFPNQRGQPLSTYQIQDCIKSLQKKHPQMKRWRCHDLRHSFAFNFLKSGGPMYQLQAILGHRSIQMTVDLYGDMKAADVERVSPYE